MCFVFFLFSLKIVFSSKKKTQNFKQIKIIQNFNRFTFYIMNIDEKLQTNKNIDKVTYYVNFRFHCGALTNLYLI